MYSKHFRLLQQTLLTFQLEHKPVQIDLSEFSEHLTLKFVSCGQSINEILFANGLTVRAAIEVHTDELLGPIFAGTLQANIHIENDIFQLSDFILLPE